MEYEYLVNLRRHHPAWRLLAADSAPLVIAFFQRCFVEPNVRSAAENDLIAKLDDFLFYLRDHLGIDAHSKSGKAYLNDWTDPERGWLRRYYPPGSDEPHFDLTPAAEQAIQWVAGLKQRQFIGTESRLKLVFELLRDIVYGSEADPQARIEQLQRQRDAIEAEIAAVKDGHVPVMDSTGRRERFMQAMDMAHQLLSDFRQVEQNFRDLDRTVRERIATWDGTKGQVLAEVFGSRDEITESDQGRSFQAFWDFLMSSERQEELTELMDRILSLADIEAMKPDPRLRRVHYDWLTAGEATQRTVAQLSEQLRRYLDDQALLENRRIMELLRNIEEHAVNIRETPPTDPVMEIDALAPTVELPMDKPLFRPPIKPVIESQAVEAGDEDVAVDILFEQMYVDKDKLRQRLRQELRRKPQVRLQDVLRNYPLEQGLAELVAWLTLATDDGMGVVDESRPAVVTWTQPDGTMQKATMPTVIYVRATSPT